MTVIITENNSTKKSEQHRHVFFHFSMESISGKNTPTFYVFSKIREKLALTPSTASLSSTTTTLYHYYHRHHHQNSQSKPNQSTTFIAEELKTSENKTSLIITVRGFSLWYSYNQHHNLHYFCGFYYFQGKCADYSFSVVMMHHHQHITKQCAIMIMTKNMSSVICFYVYVLWL